MEVIRWLDSQPEENLFISVVTIGEIRKGIVKIESSQPEKYQKLDEWLHKLIQRFEPRIITLDREIMWRWGDLSAKAEQAGKRLPIVDSLIAATAINHQLTLVTRNESDFSSIDVPLYNPWSY